MLLTRRNDAEQQQRRHRRDVGVQDIRSVDAIDPHHRRGRVADHAAGAAGIARGDDRGEIADVEPVAENVLRNRAADHRSGDVVEKRRQHEHHHQQHETAFPVVRQPARQDRRHAGLLEVPRQDRKADQEAEQVDQDDCLVTQVAGQVEGRPERQELQQDDRAEPAHGDFQRALVQQCDAEQGQREQQEFRSQAEQLRRVVRKRAVSHEACHRGETNESNRALAHHSESAGSEHRTLRTATACAQGNDGGKLAGLLLACSVLSRDCRRDEHRVCGARAVRRRRSTRSCLHETDHSHHQAFQA